MSVSMWRQHALLTNTLINPSTATVSHTVQSILLLPSRQTRQQEYKSASRLTTWGEKSTVCVATFKEIGWTQACSQSEERDEKKQFREVWQPGHLSEPLRQNVLALKDANEKLCSGLETLESVCERCRNISTYRAYCTTVLDWIHNKIINLVKKNLWLPRPQLLRHFPLLTPLARSLKDGVKNMATHGQMNF